MKENCSVTDLRLTIELYTRMQVNDQGEATAIDIAPTLMANVDDWFIPDDDAYYCVNCEDSFRRWESARAHVTSGEVTS